jgi:hypothetical protein
VAQRVGRGIALLFHYRGTPRPHFTPGKDTVPILQETRWAPGPVWTDGKSCPHRDSIPDRPARSQSLYRLSYPAHHKDGIPHYYTYVIQNHKISIHMHLTKQYCRLYNINYARHSCGISVYRIGGRGYERVELYVPVPTRPAKGWNLYFYIQGDSVARGPKLLFIKNYVIDIMAWKFIYTYREWCKTGPAHNRCWN